MPANEPDHHAPEGASCAQHPERPASFTCPRCGNYACIFCWHSSCARCDGCLKRDPTEAAPPIPWENREQSWLQRYVATFVTAMHARATAPAFARDDLRSAFGFFLLSALPLAALSGIIPNTKTLMFGGSFAVIVQGKPSSGQIALDVVLAMLMQLAAFALDMLALSLPFVSLMRAYAPEKRAVALRVLCYRSWLVPAATLIFFLAMWCLPAQAGTPQGNEAPLAVSILLAGQFLLNFMLFTSMRSAARLAAGIGPVLSYVVVIVAFIVRFLVQLLVETGARGLLPKP